MTGHVALMQGEQAGEGSMQDNEKLQEFVEVGQSLEVVLAVHNANTPSVQPVAVSA